MRTITEIIIHCTATEAGKLVTIAQIDQWHKARGWKGCGYHFLILQNGHIQTGRHIAEVGAHCHGHNAHSIGIAYVGGMLNGKPNDTRTFEQIESMVALIEDLSKEFPTIIAVKGHNEYSHKACPCFNVQAFCMVHNLPPYNIAGSK